jgi:hypothetical protein
MKRPIVAIDRFRYSGNSGNSGNTGNTKSSSNTGNSIKDIVNLFEKVNINSENELDSLISKINEIKVHDSDFEWDRILENYENLIKFKNMDPVPPKPFEVFMDKIDSMNQYYMKHIDLNPETYTREEGYDNLSIKDLVKEIKNSLEESLNIKDSSKKLNHVLIAYKHMIDITCEFTGKRLKKSYSW